MPLLTHAVSLYLHRVLWLYLPRALPWAVCASTYPGLCVPLLTQGCVYLYLPRLCASTYPGLFEPLLTQGCLSQYLPRLRAYLYLPRLCTFLYLPRAVCLYLSWDVCASTYPGQYVPLFTEGCMCLYLPGYEPLLTQAVSL